MLLHRNKRIVDQIVCTGCGVGGRDEWKSGLYRFRQVIEVKLGRVASNFGWVISEA